MVWWIQNSKSNNSSRNEFDFRILSDIIYQKVNIMFDCNNANVNGYDYHILLNMGVNIFNVDLTKYDMNFYGKIKNILQQSEEIIEMYSDGFNRPVGFSVMLSVKQNIDIDDRVDIIILKNITKTVELFEFRKRNSKFSSIPILSWPQNFRIEDLNELIKMSAGIILDRNFSDGLNEIIDVLKTAKEVHKPVFHFEQNIVKENYDDNCQSQNSRIIMYGKDIVTYGFDGVIIPDSVGTPPMEFVQSLVKATEIAQYDVQPDMEYFRHSSQIKLPILPPVSSAFGASIAALKSNAEAIIVLTKTGASARIVSHTSPPCQILAVTAHVTTARYMHLYKKVMPIYYNKKRAASWHEECRARIVFGMKFGLKIGLFNFLAKLVVLTPQEDDVGYCNSFQIVQASDMLNTFDCECSIKC